MQNGRAGKLVSCAAAAAAAALMAVPVAQARVAEGTGSARVDKAPVYVRTDARHAALLNRYPNVVPVIVQERGESKIAQMHRHLASLDLPRGQAPVASASSSFDWTDAGIGAGAVFGLALLAGAGSLLSRRRLVTA